MSPTTPEFAATPPGTRRSVAVANRDGGDALFVRVDRIESLTEMERLIERLEARERTNRLAAARYILCDRVDLARKAVARADRFSDCIDALRAPAALACAA